MFYYQARIKYLGTQYYGWQIQASPTQPTIQSQLHNVLQKICNHPDVKSIGASRTDRGVHALAQIARLDLPVEQEPERLMHSLNSLLPRDIVIEQLFRSDENFHPLRQPWIKEYRYYFSNNPAGCITQDLLSANCPYPLDWNAVEQACSLFVGEHDFCNYYCQGTPVRSTVRKVTSCQLLRCDELRQWGGEPYYCISIIGHGFLKQMVRLIVGAIWAAGRGKVTPLQLAESLNVKMEQPLAAVAPSSGLWLYDTSPRSLN